MRLVVLDAGKIILGVAAFILISRRTVVAEDSAGREVLVDGYVHVAATASLSVDQARAIVARARPAYEFVAGEMRWTTDVRKEPLTIKVIADEYAEKTNHSFGLTVNANLLLIHASWAMDAASAGTLAHEFTHMQIRRILHGGRMVPLPSYLSDGFADQMSRSYYAKRLKADPSLTCDKTKQDVRCLRMRERVRDLAKLTRSDAQSVFGAVRSTPTEHRGSLFAEIVGSFFFEYLHHRDGGGLPDIDARMGKVIEAEGEGASFDTAFKDNFKMTLPTAQGRFLEFLDETARQPKERFRATSYETELSQLM